MGDRFKARARHRSALTDDIGIAARAATRQGVCPMRLLGEYFTNHWVTVELCSAFVCAGCVADPEDLYGAGTLDMPF